MSVMNFVGYGLGTLIFSFAFYMFGSAVVLVIDYIRGRS
jgi:hypothetical protein